MDNSLVFSLVPGESPVGRPGPSIAVPARTGCAAIARSLGSVRAKGPAAGMAGRPIRRRGPCPDGLRGSVEITDLEAEFNPTDR